MKSVALSTVDNPFNPFENFEGWYLFDVEMGYNSCGLLSRFAHTSSWLTDQMNNAEIERAVDEILKNDMTGMFCKVVFDEPEIDSVAAAAENF